MKWYVSSISTFVVIVLLSSSAVQAAIIAPSTLSSSVSPVGKTTTQFKSFREWKNGMILASQERVKAYHLALSQKARGSASDPNLMQKPVIESGLNKSLAELQQQAEKEQYQLSLAKDLTITDYFVGYLTKQKDLSTAINEVSGRLSPDEVAELMYAYANNFFSSKRSVTPAPSRADSGQ